MAIGSNRKKNFKKMVFIKTGKYQCQFCDKQLNSEDTTVDHFIPSARGGIDTYTNYRLSCQPCNIKKGSSFESFDPGCLLNDKEITMLKKCGGNWIKAHERNILNKAGRYFKGEK